MTDNQVRLLRPDDFRAIVDAARERKGRFWLGSIRDEDLAWVLLQCVDIVRIRIRGLGSVEAYEDIIKHASEVNDIATHDPCNIYCTMASIWLGVQDVLNRSQWSSPDWEIKQMQCLNALELIEKLVREDGA